MPGWRFYGRRAELAKIDAVLAREQFFFCAIQGRRRIGKTSLVQEVLRRRKREALYVQIPDSDERGVIMAVEDAIEDSGLPTDFARVAASDLSTIAYSLAAYWRLGRVTALDEFQYFNRSALSAFPSYLQNAIDTARRREMESPSRLKLGGLITLGSIHTEMTAILEDKASPLFNRVTDRIEIGHWDGETLFEMFREHQITDRHQQLFLWSLFEGVPKFYRDCHDQGILTPSEEYRKRTLRQLFFEGSSPLKDEADNWFLRELRGRYDVILSLIARSGPVSHGSLKTEYDRAGDGKDKQLAGYLKVLIEKYQMVSQLRPIFSTDNQRNSRYTISDNFLAAWLSAIQRQVRSARIQPLDGPVERASESLLIHEGFMFEKLVRQLIEECSRKGRGDFQLSEFVSGYWNKPDGRDIEIDVVAVSETTRTVRFGSCKRQDRKHTTEAVRAFEGHISRFLETPTGRRFRGWEIEKALYAPNFSPEMRRATENQGYLCYDLNNFELLLN